MTPPWSEWFVRGSEGALDKRRRGTNEEEAYYWRIGRGGELHERARVGCVSVLPSGSPRGIPRRVVMSRDSPRSERDSARNTRI